MTVATSSLADALPPPPDMGQYDAASPIPASANTLSAQKHLLKDAVQQSLTNNPEVIFRWHAFLAADKEQDAAIGGYLPKVDVTAGKGRERRNDPTLIRDYTRTSRTISLTQMLYDGFFTRNEVKRLDHARMTRLFELHDASESTALEVVRAYLDVLRYRKLVGLAEENYVRHRSVLEQIQLKVKAGVGRRVDLEQATGRLALAESNLLVETSNLHDVSARYQRLVGVQPAKELEEPKDFKQGIPANGNAAQASAQVLNPALRAAIENVRSADAAHSQRYANFQPRFDFRLRKDLGTDLNGLSGDTNNRVAEVVMTWNLFNGFSDYNRVRQYAEQINVARDQRDKACRDARQTLAIAYNDSRKLAEQLTYLDQHQLSIEKARDAYRKQFDIGQRTLLDVLDTENELFQSRRAYVNADYDLKLAYARVHAGIGTLTEAVGVSRVDQAAKNELANQWAAGEEGAQRCPADGPSMITPDKKSLDARAAEMLRELAPKGPDGTPAAAPEADVEAPAQKIALALKAWVSTWSGKNVTGYLDAYAKTFIPADGASRDAWAAKRKQAVERASDIKIELSDVKVEVRDATHAISTFTQNYQSSQFKDVVAKTLEWEKIDNRWLIVGEASKPLAAAKAVKLKTAAVKADAKPEAKVDIAAPKASN